MTRAGGSPGNPLGKRHAILLTVVLLAIVATVVMPRVPQDPQYHVFADQRPLFGVVNGMNVLSNLPFILVGFLGLAATRGQDRNHRLFLDPWERWPYVVFFTGVMLTALGSGHYHIEPDNASMFWDRLPITVAFMGLLSALLAERVSLALSKRLLVPLLLLGAGSVAYWYWSELQNAGDLRLYLLVQFGSLLIVLLLLILYPARYKGTAYIAAAMAAYVIGGVSELLDKQIYEVGHVISGHTIKHLAAAAGVYLIVAMLRTRR